MYILSLDIGGTKIESNLVFFSKDNRETPCLASYPLQKKETLFLLNKKRIQTQREKGLKHITKNILNLVKETISSSKIELHNLAAISLSLPGPISYSKGTLPVSNTRALENTDFISQLQQELNQTPLFYENDGNCFAFAEHWLGLGPEISKKIQLPLEKISSFGLILGTGVGGGAIINGKIHQGVHGGAGEVGHFSLNPSGALCFCGQRGCAELYLSGPGLKRTYHENQNGNMETKPESIFKKAQNDECESSVQSLKEYSKYLEILLENIMLFFDPHFIVIGGGLSNQNYIYKNFNPGVEHPFIKNSFSPVAKHRISDAAGGLGAALLAYEKIKRA